MSETGKKQTAILLGSVAVNIFLAAFVLGRLSTPGTMPAPPFGGDMQRQMMMGQHQQMMQGGDPMRGSPHQMMQGAPGGQGFGGPPGSPGGFGGQNGPGGFGGQQGGMPHPPPLFEANQMFKPQDMQQAAAEMKENFDKVQNLRKDFAARLMEGNVSKEDIVRHFAEVDGVMDGVKAKMREKAAEKISSMSDEERKQFASRMLEQRPGPFGGQGPGGMPQGPGGMPGGMPGMQGGMNGGPPGGPPR